jgi:hypothetical protein
MQEQKRGGVVRPSLSVKDIQPIYLDGTVMNPGSRCGYGGLWGKPRKRQALNRHLKFPSIPNDRYSDEMPYLAAWSQVSLRG